MLTACTVRVRGVVQGVGFRPFVYRLALANALKGWVLNGEQGVEIYLEGDDKDIETFLQGLRTHPPPAASISELELSPVPPVGASEFAIRESEHKERPTVRISPDLPVCEACLGELFDPQNLRFNYPYINCTDCGPRYTVILQLPYDRPNTTMKEWPLDAYCSAEYRDPTNRRFHAQPVACPKCGPTYLLRAGDGLLRGNSAISRAAEMLSTGQILAIKGLGGYHLACDARNTASVAALRERKFRKEKPFAVMTRDLNEARKLIDLSSTAESLLRSAARPIILAKAKVALESIAPDTSELGVMLPYTPLHYLLFNAGAPSTLVMTSANRSSEPIAYQDDEAADRLSGIADAFLIGERPIARRVDDSVARDGVFGPMILRRARGYAPGAVSRIPSKQPILALGADLKNAITLVVDGQAFVSQHIGDLEHYEAHRAFQETISDLLSMYEVKLDETLVVHDAHPQYHTTGHARALQCCSKSAIQHHRAHIASVLAEREAWSERVVGVSFDGTGFGDDGSIWGGEIFVGSITQGFERVAHLRVAALPGGDAAAHYPVQASAGFLAQLDGCPEMTETPFYFPPRFQTAMELVRKGVRTFSTTSVGRLFDTVASLIGFTREITFEGQAAMWLEQLALQASNTDSYSLPFEGVELDFRPLLRSVVLDRQSGRDPRQIARAFQRGLASGVRNCILQVCDTHGVETVVLSGGVFQNELLLHDLRSSLEGESVAIWTNHLVPANDGGISLGQAALAAFQGTHSRP